MSERAFLDHLEGHFPKETDALASWRAKSWQTFSERGLPGKSQEAFRYVSLKELYLSSFKIFEKSKIDKARIAGALLPECKHAHLVFLDGAFAPELSDLSALPPQRVLLALNEALRTRGSLVQHHFATALQGERDPFSLLNFALHPEGLFFYLPPKLEVEPPIQCLYVMTGNSASFPRIHLIAGAQSKMRWVFTSHALEPELSYFVAPAVELAMEEGASVDIFTTAGPAPLSWHMETWRAALKRDAHLSHFSASLGAKAMRQSLGVQLKGENSEADLRGLWMLGDHRTAHTHAVVDHEAPYTCSMQLFKGVLGGSSRSSFEGKIYVRPAAQKTEAYQLNHNLLLSPGAQAAAKPNLEVFADDVKASHGATVSQLNSELLFYLKTRGIDPVTGKRLLVTAFCREMIGQIPYASLLRKIQNDVEGVL